MEDERFAKFATDPKFRTAPKKQKKLKIDSRFQRMFNDARFNNKQIGIDKRGRPKSYVSKESYEQFYRLQSSDESDSNNEERESKTVISAKSLKAKLDKVERGKKFQKEASKREEKLKKLKDTIR